MLLNDPLFKGWSNSYDYNWTKDVCEFVTQSFEETFTKPFFQVSALPCEILAKKYTVKKLQKMLSTGC